MSYGVNRKADEALDRLAALPGMYQVKQQVEQMIQLAKVAKLRERHRLKTRPQSQHMIFTGNPGTGKTTAARLIGEAFAAIGLLKTDQEEVPFVEIHHSSIASPHVGEAEKTMAAKFKSARGGVIFIDEAYSFVGKSDHRTDEKVIATIVQCIEDMRDEVVVIAAGYTNKMSEFLRSNPGLPSRFPTTIDFPDYSVADLIRIAQQMLKDQEYQASPDYLEALSSVLWIEKSRKGFGNARTVRNHVERSIRRHAVRISSISIPSRNDLVTLLSSDLVYSVSEVKKTEKDILKQIILDAQNRLFEIDLKEVLQGQQSH